MKVSIFLSTILSYLMVYGHVRAEEVVQPEDFETQEDSGFIKSAFATGATNIKDAAIKAIRDGDTMLIKASGSTLETMTDEDLVRCNLDGNALDDEKKKPSMEVSFHAWILKSFPEIKCIKIFTCQKMFCIFEIFDGYYLTDTIP